MVGFDVDRAGSRRIAAGDSPVEDITDQRLATALDSGRYRPTTDRDDAAGFDVAVITVPTPLREGIPDLTFIEAAARSLAPHSTRGATVVLESTTYPGTTEELVVPLLEVGSGLRAGDDFYLGYCPSASTPATGPGPSSTPPRWCPASTGVASRGPGASTTASSTRPSRCPRRRRPSSPSCWRTPSDT